MSAGQDLPAVLGADTPGLSEVLDLDAVREVLGSFLAMFGLPVWFFDHTGRLIAEARRDQPRSICEYAGQFASGRTACANTVQSVRDIEPGADRRIVHGCFTGASYVVFTLSFDGRVAGKVVLGPYLPAERMKLPPTMLRIVQDADGLTASQKLVELPRVAEETLSAIVSHLHDVLDVMIYQSHRAMVVSQMHLASVQESFRELQEKNRELSESYDRLKGLDKLKSDFLATISHELRTPLTSILGYSEMLREGIAGDLNPEQGEYVRTIHERSEQLLKLITSLLDLARLEQGTMPIVPGTVSLATLATEVIATFMPVARRKNVQVRLEADPGAPEAMGDRERLRQVLNNLIDNAIKFTPEGGVVIISVVPIPGLEDVAADPDGDPDDAIGFALLAPAHSDVEVSVTDSGMGVPIAERQRVFDAFYQVDSSSTREFGGAGLGLSIVKKIVDGHRGRVFVESPPAGVGTRMVVQLPSGQT